MEQPKNFRSAFNGFNREDVVHYLEYINTKHNNLVSKLTEDAKKLRDELNEMSQEGMAALESRCAELEGKLNEAVSRRAELSEQLDRAESRCAALEETIRTQESEMAGKISQLEAALEEAKKETAAAKEQAASAQANAAQELEAYRRAERAEREAKERAQKIHTHTNSVLEAATAKVNRASEEVETVAAQILAQLSQLQAAVGASRQSLDEAAAALGDLNPAEETASEE